QDPPNSFIHSLGEMRRAAELGEPFTASSRILLEAQAVPPRVVFDLKQLCDELERGPADTTGRLVAMLEAKKWVERWNEIMGRGREVSLSQTFPFLRGVASRYVKEMDRFLRIVPEFREAKCRLDVAGGG